MPPLGSNKLPNDKEIIMSWRDVQSLNIFAPANQFYQDNWVEQILGTTIKPIYEQYEDDIRWLWVTRYAGKYNEAKPPTGTQIPEEYLLNGHYRYIWFRISILEDTKEQLQDDLLGLANSAGCYIHPNGWMDYDVVNDLGSNRFIIKGANTPERINRAKKVAYFIDATVRLMLDMLIEEKPGLWVFESNENEQNPNGSVFESVHHLFCNSTQVPTTVILSVQNNELRVRTFRMSQIITIPLDEQENWPIQVPLSY
jgi:hypothetical protein